GTDQPGDRAGQAARRCLYRVRGATAQSGVATGPQPSPAQPAGLSGGAEPIAACPRAAQGPHGVTPHAAVPPENLSMNRASLAAAMDRAMQDASRNDMVQNTLEAMGRMADEHFDEPIRRAFEHPHSAVRQAAYGAIGRSCKLETIRSTFAMFLQMDGRSRNS